jgi:hypothetical protein
MAACDSAPRQQTAGGPEFGDGTFQPNDMVTIHDVSNLEEGLSAGIIAYDPDKGLYVVKDCRGSIWGLRKEKLRPQRVLELPEGDFDWHDVPDGVVVGVPQDAAEFKRLFHSEWFDAVGVSVSTDRHLDTLAQCLPQLKAGCDNLHLRLFVGGPMAMLAPERLQGLGAEVVSEDAPATVRWLTRSLALAVPQS